MSTNSRERTCSYRRSPHLPLIKHRLPSAHHAASRYTPIGGQDPSQPLPYDPQADIPSQIQASVQTSLKNLRTTYLDSLLLHSPLHTVAETVTAWRTLVGLQDSGLVRKIGVSNTYDVGILEALEGEGGRRTDVVQNRWFEGNQWNNDVWAYCVRHGIQYQYVHLFLPFETQSMR